MGEPTSETFRDVMSCFATGVTVMTTMVADVPHGMTANAVASVSLDPLLVLVCVERDTAMVDQVRQSGVFALSMLSARQEALSVHFAAGDRPDGDAMFAAAPYAGGITGSPLLAGALAWLDCRVWASYDGGDHVIVVGEVADLAVADDGRDRDGALIYFRHGYRAVAG